MRNQAPEAEIAASMAAIHPSWHRRLFNLGIWLLLISAVMICLRRHDYIPLIPAPGMSHAGLYHWSAFSHPRGILVLANGACDTSGQLFRQLEWRSFAVMNRLAIVEIAFASPREALFDGTGYYYASHGSGWLFEKALEKCLPGRLPLLLFGYSGGGHFVSRYAAWHPGRCVAWCASGVGWWDQPAATGNAPPGLLICGDQDSRLEAMRRQYALARELALPWTLLEIPQMDHIMPASRIGHIQDFLGQAWRTRQTWQEGKSPAAE